MKGSFAGQFLTFVDVEFEQLADKISKVINHAKKKGVKVWETSVIVQEYIVCDYS
jgi:hypothetical protein